MSYPINYPTPQNANVQIFHGGRSTGVNNRRSWVKPQGASFVWFTLIGAGSSGDNAVGGNSGNVVNCMIPAFLVPDVLTVNVGGGGTGAGGAGSNTSILYDMGPSPAYTLITAQGGAQGGAANTADVSNNFTAAGIYQSTLGVAGSAGAVSASTTNFLSPGGGTTTQASNYGYSTGSTGNRDGFFQMQPIIVGAGGMGTGSAGIGCGGGLSAGSGGNGLAVIITW